MEFEVDTLVNTYAIPWGIKIISAVAIFVIGRWVASRLVGLLKTFLGKMKWDPMLVDFFGSITNTLLLLVIIVAALQQLGVDTTSLIALIGAAGLAVGLALKDSLQNFAAGVMLIIFRPFKNGDFVTAAGVSGVVEQIGIFCTVFRTGDNQEIIVPNHGIYAGNIINASARSTRRIDLVIGIDYSSDIKKAKDILLEMVSVDERILDDPEPGVAVAELADSSVNFNVRPWVKTEDYWGVRADLLEAVKIRFDQEGIGIPFPQIDIHLNKVDV